MRMLLNVGIDVVGGMVPVVGDAFDLVWRANIRNLALLERHQGELEPRARASDYAIVAGATVVATATVALPFLALWWVIGMIGRGRCESAVCPPPDRLGQPKPSR